MNLKRKYDQLTVAQWKTPTGGLNHTLFALGEDGRPYVLRSGEGFVDAELDILKRAGSNLPAKAKMELEEGGNDPF
jgi:hypothetical protein